MLLLSLLLRSILLGLVNVTGTVRSCLLLVLKLVLVKGPCEKGLLTSKHHTFAFLSRRYSKIWPKAQVEPRHYRLRLLNGCDSRFLALQLVSVLADAPEEPSGLATNSTTILVVPMTIIGGDQGLSWSSPVVRQTVVLAPGQRLDTIVDFSPFATGGRRLVLKNLAGDHPFIGGGGSSGGQKFAHTDKVMAFDVTLPLDEDVPDAVYQPPTVVEGGSSAAWSAGVSSWLGDTTQTPGTQQRPALGQDLATTIPEKVRRVGLFHGRDSVGGMQPLLGTIDPAHDVHGNPICWPDEPVYQTAGLVGPMNGTAAWHHPTTENIRLGAVEDWQIWNLSPHAHPIHLHMVHFIVVNRQQIQYDSASSATGELDTKHIGLAAGDGTFTTEMPMILHDGTLGVGRRVVNPTEGRLIQKETMTEYVETFPQDVVVALPGQITTIRAKFDKPGRFNWHCHMLAHEDHEMMRIYHVGELPADQQGGACGIGSATPAYDEPCQETPPPVNGDGKRNSSILDWTALVLAVIVAWAVIMMVSGHFSIRSLSFPGKQTRFTKVEEGNPREFDLA